MAEKALVGFGEEIRDLQYNDFWDWFVKVYDINERWKAQPTYLIAEFSYYAIALLTLIHSLRVGGRFRWLWIGTILHGLVVECMSYWVPDIDNFWHSQTTIVLLGRRLPLHIMFLYPAFIYTASVAVSRLRLPKWAEPFAVGATVVLLDSPYDITSVKFVHWTWHDTDPNIYDRFYWVPWTSFYFHATFACSFTFFFHFWRRLIIGKKDNQWESGSCFRELICTVLTALCGTPGGILQFLPLYHPLHDIYGIHTEIIVIMLLGTFVLLAWTADRAPVVGSRGGKSGITEITLVLLLHYSIYLVMAIFYYPEDEVSIGLHEPIGDCESRTPVQTAFGMVLSKRTYLCTSDYNEAYFDFSCLPNQRPASDGISWYTICGTKFENRAEYIAILSMMSLTAFFVFRNFLYRSGSEVVPKNRRRTPDDSKKKR